MSAPINPLQAALRKLILEVLNEKQLQSGVYKPEIGTVINVNGDGTISVQTDSNHYASCNAATVDCYVVGLKVTVFQASGVQVAIPTIAAGTGLSG